MRRQPGEVVHIYRDGTKICYFPSQGSSTKYIVKHPVVPGVIGARTLADAREAARELREEGRS